MIQWIEQYIKALVQHQDQVSVTQKEGVNVVVVSLALAAEDVALFSGRNNRLMRALNTVISLAGAKARKRYLLKVQDA